MNEDTNFQSTSEERIVTERKKKRKSRKVFLIFKIIIDIILFTVLIGIVASAVLGYLNMQAINENKEPIWCMNESVLENKNEIKRTCDLGIFRIVKIEDSKETVVSLKPFFISD